MLKKSKIQTLLVSTTENGEDLIRTAAVGGCLIEETGVMLRYPESDNHGTVTLLLTDTLADLKRRGDISSRMTFIDGKLLPCPYTPRLKVNSTSVSTPTPKVSRSMPRAGDFKLVLPCLLPASK